MVHSDEWSWAIQVHPAPDISRRPEPRTQDRGAERRRRNGPLHAILHNGCRCALADRRANRLVGRATHVFLPWISENSCGATWRFSSGSPRLMSKSGSNGSSTRIFSVQAVQTPVSSRWRVRAIQNAFPWRVAPVQPNGLTIFKERCSCNTLSVQWIEEKVRDPQRPDIGDQVVFAVEGRASITPDDGTIMVGDPFGLHAHMNPDSAAMLRVITSTATKSSVLAILTDSWSLHFENNGDHLTGELAVKGVVPSTIAPSSDDVSARISCEVIAPKKSTREFADVAGEPTMHRLWTKLGLLHVKAQQPETSEGQTRKTGTVLRTRSAVASGR